MKLATPLVETQKFESPRLVPKRATKEKYGLEFDQNKKTLVMDLDRTLVYLTLEAPSKEVEYSVVLDGVEFRSYAIKRPGLDAFMKEMSVFYNICIYTGMKRKHAINVVESVGLAPFVFEVYGREQCIKVSEKTYMKSLLELGFSFSSTIFMDNSPNQMRSQPLNGILVQSFKGEDHDSALSFLAPFLQSAISLDDVRPVTDKLFAFFESAKEQTKPVKRKNQKSSPTNTTMNLPLIVEEKEEKEEKIIPRAHAVKKHSSFSKAAKNETMKSSCSAGSQSTSASGTLSRSSLILLPEQETDKILAQLEIVRASSLKLRGLITEL